MKLKSPKNVNIEISTLQDNIECFNMETNTDFSSLFNQYSFPSSMKNFNPKNVLNNTIQSQNLLYSNSSQKNNEIIPKPKKDNQITSNLKFNLFNITNTSAQSKKNFPLKQNNESLKISNFTENSIQNNNKLIKPILSNIEFKESNNFSNRNDILNKSLMQIDKGKIEFKESVKFKERKKFNKFKVFRIKPKKINRKEKISIANKRKRKYKPDDIRKKIKARFHKSIKNIINENLRKAGSNKLFSFLPQVFISSISRAKNHQILNISYRDLIKKDFLSELDEKKYKNKYKDLIKYKRNLNVLKYLDENPDICQKSGFDIISKMKYRDLLEEYFRSDEFDKAINKLREENEEEDYIKEYIIKAKSYVKFFSVIPFNINIRKITKKDNVTIEIKGNEKENINENNKDNNEY